MAVIGKRRRSRLVCVTQGKSGDQPGYTIPRDESRKSKE